VGDVDNDDEAEFVVAGDFTGTIDLFNLDGTSLGSFASGFGAGDGFDVGDLDGDRVAEIAVADSSTGMVQFFDQTGTVKTSFATSFDSGDGFAIADVRRLTGSVRQGIGSAGGMLQRSAEGLLGTFPAPQNNFVAELNSLIDGGIPLVDETLDEVVDFVSLFDDLADRLLEAPVVPGVVVPDLSFTTPQTVVVQINGLLEEELSIAAGPYASMAALVNHINNVSLPGSPLDGLVVAADDGGLLTLAATDAGLAESLTISTLRITAPGAAAPFGQLGAETTFSIDLHRDVDDNNIDEIDSFTILLADAPILNDPAPATNDNIETADLVEDLNTAFLLAGLIDVLATIDPASGNIALAATDPEIKRLVLYEDNAGEEITGLGFTDGDPASEVDETYDPLVPVAPTSPLGLIGFRDVAGLIYNTVESFETALQDALTDLSDGPLPGGFDVDAQYDETTDTIEFNLALTKDFSRSVELDFNDGLALGSFGTLEVVADAEGTFSAQTAFELRAGIYLGALGGTFSLTAATPLSNLNGGSGVPLNVGMTAANAAPVDGKLAADVEFDLTVNGGLPVTVSIDDADTISDNFDLFALAADINDALAVAGIDSLAQAATNIDEGKLTLVAVDASVYSLEVTDVSNLIELGFVSGQQGDRPDMVITVNAVDYDVNLDGATTVGDVIAKIQAQAPVGVAPNADKGLTVTANTMGEVVSIATYMNDNGTPSAAAAALGIQGGNGTDTIVGSPLHGETETSRVYLLEPAPNETNIAVDVDVVASGITLSAALGLLGLTVTDSQPLALTLDTDLRLIDPGTEAADGRITLNEILDASALTDWIEFNAPTTSFSGELEIASPLLGELNNGGDTFSTITLSGDLFNPDFNITFNDEALDGLKNLSITEILNVVRDVLSSIESSASIPWMDEPIPLVGSSLNEVLDFVDDLVTKVDEVISSFDLTTIDDARDSLETAIGDLGIDFEDRSGMFDALDRLTSVITEAFAAADTVTIVPALSGPEIERAKSRLVAATREIRRQIDEATALLPPNTPGLTELDTAIDQFEAPIPDMEKLEERLEEKLSTELSAVIGVPVDFRFDFVDYDGNTPQREQALIVGLNIDGSDLIDETFTPDLSLPVFGPIELSLDGDVSLYAGGELNLGFGAQFGNGAFEPFVIVDPPTVGPFVNPDLFETGLDLNAAFDVAALTGQVRFGNLELLEGQVDLSLVRGVEDTVAVDSGGNVALSDTPIDGNERLVVVKVDGETSIRDVEDFSISGSTLTFAANAKPTAGTLVTVAYRTATAGDPENNVADRAGIAVRFTHPVTDGNTIGAVSVADFIADFGSEIDITAEGVVTGSVDTEFLNSLAEDVVTLAVNINDPLDPQLVVDQDALTDMFENVEFDLVTIVDAIIATMDLVEEGLTNDVMAKLPLIGGALDTTGTFIGKMRDDYVQPFRDFLEDEVGSLDDVRDEVQTFVFDALGPDGIDILGDRNVDSLVDASDVEVELSSEAFQIVVTLTGGDETFVDFDSKLGGLPIDFQASGGVRVGWDYNIDFGVGVSRSGGAYLVLNNDAEPEFDFNVDIGLKVDNSGPEPVPTSAGISLFGLNLTAEDVLQDDGTRGTGFGGQLKLDLLDTAAATGPFDDDGTYANDLVLPFSEIVSQPFYETFEVELTTDDNVGINLLLKLDINDNLPSIETELSVEWGITLNTGPNGIELTTTGAPELEFRDITLNFGDFISRIIGPVVQDVDDLIEPIKPVVKFLTAEVPGLTQLSQLAGRGPVTFFDLAFIRNPEQGQKAKKFLGVVESIITVVDALADLDEDDQVTLNFGTVVIGAGNGVDLQDPFWNTDNGSLDGAIPGFLNANPTSTEDQINGGGSAALAKAFGEIEREPDTSGLGGLGISLEILKPTNLIKMLIGQTADIVTWDIPIFQLDFTLEQSFRPIPPVQPLVVTVGFDLGVFADFSVGLDTRGIQTGNFFDGFFFGDLEDVISGPDIDEMGFSIGVRLRAELDLLIASAGIEGALVASILANWNDQDGDGKLYLDEIAGIIEQDGLQCVFDLRGELRAIVRLVWEVFGKEGSKDIVDALLFEFENECPKFEVASVSEGGESLAGGFTSQAGDLLVHAGSLAGQRQPGVTTDVAEEFTITQMAPGVVEVDGMGFKQRFGGVSRIYVDGGKGNDIITLVNVTDMDAILLGGDGNDILISGDGNDTIIGGSGNDIITTGIGSDTIDAGSGADTIDSGPGDDTIDAGAGADDIISGQGVDTIDAGSGADTVDAGSEDDTILGGPGNDIITAGLGADTVDAGAGDDIVTGNAGADIIYGGLGADDIQGNDGNDEIHGDGGNDVILGQAGQDLIYGGPGRDRIEGNEEDDVIYGGSGADLIFGNDGNDQLYGDAGHDRIEGAEGNDLLVGGNDNDLLIGGAGDDDLFGGYGDDIIISYVIGDVADPALASHYIEGGPDDDFVCGTTVDDEIYGGTADVGFLAGYVDIDNPPGPPLPGGFSIDSCLQEDDAEFTAPPSTTIGGVKFEDLDGNGLWDNGEPTLGGFTIELLDIEGEIVDATETSDVDGSYAFTVEDPGTYTVREVQQEGYFQTFPGGNTYEVSAVGETIGNLDFGNLTLASVHGFKWRDDDGDGLRDDGEPGLAGVFVFADSNGNGVFDLFSADRGTLTMADDPETEDVDETGAYWIENLMPGTYEVLEEVPVGYTKTFPVREIVYANQFEQLGVGPEWSSNEKTGLLAIDRTPQNQRGFLGQESGDASEPNIPELLGSETLTLELNNAPVAPTQLDISFDLFIYGSWDGNDAVEGEDQFRLRVDGNTLLETTFSNLPAVPQAYPDPLGGNNPAQTGAEETSTLGYDREGLPLGDANFTAADAVYRFDFSVPHAGSQLELDFRGLLADTGAEDFEYWGIDNLRISYPIDGHTVTLASGETREGLDFGNQADPGGIHGTKFEDLDGDGRRDPNEPGLGGVTIYVDENGNGRRDIGELRTTTMEKLASDANDDGLVGVFDVAILQRDFRRSTGSPADLDGNGIVERADLVAMLGDFGSSGGATDPSQVGEYWLTDLLPGDYVIAEIIPEGFVEVPTTVYENTFDTLPGSEWSNPQWDVAPNSETFLGQLGEEAVSLELDALPDHAEMTVEFDLYVIGPWDGAADAPNGPDQWMLSVEGGPTLAVTSFSNDASGVGQNFPDASPGAVHPALFGAIATGSLGYPGSPGSVSDAVYRLSYTFAHADDAVKFDFSAAGIEGIVAGSVGETWGLDNVRVKLAGGQRIVTLDGGDVITSIDIANARPGEVTGNKWRDDNADGQQGQGEPGLGGVTIYSDINGSGQLDAGEPSTITASSGNIGTYRLTGLMPGNHIIREMEPDGMLATFPAAPYLVTLASGQKIAGIDFGNTGRGSIHGTKYEDLNGNGRRDVDAVGVLEPGLPGVTIYADLNGNGQLDSWEPSTVTMNDDTSTPDDEAGRYWLSNVPPGDVVVREVVPAGFSQTEPQSPDFYSLVLSPGEQLDGFDFGNQNDPEDGEVHGLKWDDLNGNGQRDMDATGLLEPGLPGVTIYADLNGNGQRDANEPATVTMADDPATTGIDETGMYWLTDIPVGNAVIREAIPLGFVRTFPAQGGYSVVITASTLLTDLDFGNQNDPEDGEVHGLKWDDLNGNGQRDMDATGLLEPGLAGVTIYADLNGNGQLDANEPSTVTMADDLATRDDETGMYWLLGLPVAEVQIREVVPPGMLQTFPLQPDYHLVRISQPGEVLTGRDFGNTLQAALATAPEDYDAFSAQLEHDLQPIANDDCYTWPGQKLAVPAPGVLGNDNSPPLEVSWFTPVSFGGGTVALNPDGSFTYDRNPLFTGLVDTFAYRIRDLNTNLESNVAIVGIADGSDLCFVLVTGTKWDDLNGDGKRNEGEPGLAGVTIYADLDKDGEFDEGEPSTVTDETGFYSLTGVPGVQGEETIVIREVVPFGWTQTYPSGAGPLGDAHVYVGLPPGSTISGADFGNADIGEIIDGADEIHGAAGADTIYGDNLITVQNLTTIGDDDLIFGQGGDDLLFGQQENDTLSGGAGFDILDGGFDTDRVVQTVDADQDLFDNLVTGQGNDTLISIERGTLTGGPSPNVIDASAFTQGPVILFGSGGNDQLTGTNNDDSPGSGSGDGGDQLYGETGDDILKGLDGDDLIDGGAGSDSLLDGGNDDDLYLFGPASGIENDTIIEGAGAGRDTLDFTQIPVEPLTLNLTTGNGAHGTRTITVSGGDAIEDIYGGPGTNDITGSAADNLIVGGPLDDVLRGQGGDDTLIGGGGANDDLQGGADDDRFVFLPGWGTVTVSDVSGSADILDFSAIGDDLTVTIGSVTVVQGGNTVSHLANAIDRIIGGSGDDVFFFTDGAMLGPAGNGTIDAGPGADRIDYSAYTTGVTVDLAAGTATGTGGIVGFVDVTGGQAGDTLRGDGVVNTILGGPGPDLIDGKGAADYLSGEAGDDEIHGGAGQDLMIGGAGSDNLFGEDDGDTYLFDVVTGGPEADTLTEALPGIDTLDFSSLPVGNDLTLNLDVGSGAHVARTLSLVNPERFEIVLAGAGDDMITGNDAADNVVDAGEGADTINAKGGSNTVFGGPGDDTYRIELAAGGDTTQIEEENNEGIDLLDFSPMTIGIGDGVAVDLSDGTGVVAQHVADATRQVTTDPAKIINLENVIGSTGDDTIVGSDAVNDLRGNDGADVIDGGLGDDLLRGELGDDILRGGKNDDTLIGGAGSNQLDGGPNDDLYRFLTAGPVTDTLVEDPASIINGNSVIGGTDTLDFSAFATPITFDLSDPGPQLLASGLTILLTDVANTPNATNFENVIGSQFAVNTLTGNAADNWLVGGANDDLISGGDGDDTLEGSLGNDQ
ncbi:MAG: SdrD B-like domain-containing protein, partial [Pirellulales bacterium]